MTTLQPTPGVHENFATELETAGPGTDAAQLIEALESAGAGMANICFNLSQETSLPASVRQSMKTGQMQWDAALRALRAARAASTPAPESHLSGVTDEMVEAACAAHWLQPWPGDRSESILNIRRSDMRKALLAALATTEGSK